MGKLKDLTGQKFGKLTVIERAENDNRGNVQWLCQCECGNLVAIRGDSVRNGHAKSCGCLTLDLLYDRFQNKRDSMIGKKFGKF